MDLINAQAAIVVAAAVLLVAAQVARAGVPAMVDLAARGRAEPARTAAAPEGTAE
jgi:hypothetical protein